MEQLARGYIEERATTLLEVLFDGSDLIEIRALQQGTKGARKRWWGTYSDLPWDEIKTANKAWDLYFGANPRPSVGTGKAADITTFRSLVVDLDHCSIDDAVSQLSGSGLPQPTAIVMTGGGSHLWWRLAEPVAVEVWRLAQKAIISRFASADRAIHDAPRIMRLPGTTNHKHGVVAEVLEVNASTHPISAFMRPKVVVAPPPPPAATTPSPADTSSTSRARLWLSKREGGTEGNRNTALFKAAACVYQDFDLDRETTLALIRDWNATANHPPLDDREVSDTVASACASARGERGAKNRAMATHAVWTSPAEVPADPTPEECPSPPPSTDSVLDTLGRECYLVIGTTQVWHDGLAMSMPLEALSALYPTEGKIWRNARDRRTVRVEDIVFEPGGAKPGQVNLWRGWPTTPDPRPCPLLVRHISVICGDDPMLRDWLTCWLALPIQKPGVKLDTAVILQGKPGSGKSIFFDCVRAIYGQYGTKATQAQIDSDYTGWLSRRLFIQAEEVGSTRGQVARVRNILKDWVTGESIAISEKYQVGRVERAHANFVFLSNEGVPLPIDSDDRRFCVICHDVVPDREYFTLLGAEIADNGPARLMHYLSGIDLGEFWEHSQPPKTAAKDDLTDLCRGSVELFLSEWKFGRLHLVPYVTARGSDLYFVYSAWAKLHGYKQESAIGFHKWFKRHSGLERRRGDDRYYLVDSTDLTRFESAMRGYLTWVDARRMK